MHGPSERSSSLISEHCASENPLASSIGSTCSNDISASASTSSVAKRNLSGGESSALLVSSLKATPAVAHRFIRLFTASSLIGLKSPNEKTLMI